MLLFEYIHYVRAYFIFYKIHLFGGRSKGKGPLRRTRRRWESNVKIVVVKLEFDDVEWVHLAQDREDLCDRVNKVTKLRFTRDQAKDQGSAL
jgi:hypothetical protein